MARRRSASSGTQVVDPRRTLKGDHQRLLERRNESLKARRPWERNWWLNLAYLDNEQYVEYTLETGHLVTRSGPEDAIRPVHNVLMKLTRSERAKLLKTEPRVMALPATPDDDSYMTAKVLTAYFDHLSWKWRLPRMLRTAAFWIVSTGNVFYKWVWNTDEPSLVIVPPFEMFPDPYARTYEECRWCIHSQYLSEEAVWDMYGDIKGAHPEYLVPSNTEGLTPLENRVYSDMAGTEGANLRGILVHEYWQPPTKHDEDGALIVFTNSGIVWEDNFPYEHGRMPFTQAVHIERSSSKWGATILDWGRPMQDEINRTEAQIIENRNLANGKWYWNDQLELSAEPNAEPRQIIKGTGPLTLEPKMLQVQPFNQAVLGEVDRLKANLQDIAGQHEVSMGGVPGRVESGQAIQLLQETDDSVMKDSIHSNEEALANGFWQVAALTKQYGSERLLVQSYDDSGRVEVQELLSDRIDLNTRVRPQTTTALPTSVAGKWDRVLNLLQYQAISPPQAIRLLGLTVEDPDLDPTELDRNEAYRENKVMRGFKDMDSDIVPRARWFEDHQTHIEVHTAFMRSEEFFQLDPKVQALYEFHIQEHKQLEQQVVAEQGQLQQAAQGQAPPPPSQPGGGGPPEGPPTGGGAEAPPPPDNAGPAEVI